MFTIAIFDHDKSIIELYQKYLKTADSVESIVYTFSNEQDVLNFVKENHIDVLITEYISDKTTIRDLEHHCGLEFLQSIKIHVPKIKIMICSTYSSHWVSDSLDNVIGIKKPVRKDEFLKTFKLLIKTG